MSKAKTTKEIIDNGETAPGTMSQAAETQAPPHIPADFAKFDHDGDGHPGGSKKAGTFVPDQPPQPREPITDINPGTSSDVQRTGYTAEEVTGMLKIMDQSLEDILNRLARLETPREPKAGDLGALLGADAEALGLEVINLKARVASLEQRLLHYEADHARMNA